MTTVAELKVGPELDAQVAEHALGCVRVHINDRGYVFGAPPELIASGDLPEDHGRVQLPLYSSDLTAAWLVHLAMCNRRFSTRRTYFKALQAQATLAAGIEVAWPDVLLVLRHRMPEAICLAALHTVEKWGPL